MVAAWLHSLFSVARIVVTHGQMKDLEKRLYAFADGRADILVCSALLETGIEIPKVKAVVGSLFSALVIGDSR